MVLQHQLRTTDSQVKYLAFWKVVLRQVYHARVGGFEAWGRLLDLALMKCFNRLPHNRRENMLFDLLHVLPVAIRSANVEESTAILLSETVLSSITKLREDRQHQIILQSVGGESESGSLPAERLYNILRNILESILDNNHVIGHGRTCTPKSLRCAYQLHPPHAIMIAR